MFRFNRGYSYTVKGSRFHGRRWESTAASTATGTASAAGTEAPSFAQRAWKTVRSKLTAVHFARAIRVGFLGIALYQAGYQAGLITYAQDPHKIEKEMMKGVIFAAGGENYHPVYHPHHIQVRRVGENLIFAAKQMCKEKIRRLELENKDLESTIDANNKEKMFATEKDKSEARHKNFDLREKLYNNKQELEMWQIAHSRLKGSWHYVVIDVPTVNAFVTAACPRRVFVHAGLLEKIHPTDDELALVMGHEISHFLLQHVEKEQSYDVGLKILQLILLTFVEPIGFFAIAYDYLVATIAQYLDAAYSRECEEEADTLGIELAARACYDTKKGTKMFEKLHNYATLVGGAPDPLYLEGTSNSNEAVVIDQKTSETNKTEEKEEREKEHASWSDSHPSWDDRIENITALSHQYSPENYSTCKSYLKKYIDSITFSLQV
eukprot:CAMPEP_0173140788 /NCGR_PEP_ID=MMETSP1105-20130129/5103_1 /TAXON_ID=2985 /ORGANISM="Ochromonas sp., Strain BG-1" /LENGTH=435 /DNA_ID=CAMNT_0014053859 /DNA_START=33 /DNA_END=1340 /DNA_ORIENTATION=-